MTFHRAASLNDVWQGEMIGVRICGQAVLLVDAGNGICAYRDRCAHKGLPLSQGRLRGTVLACAAHGWEYDARTGCGINPASVELARLQVKVEGDDILVDVPEGDAGGR